jgi:hypothetical protein
MRRSKFYQTSFRSWHEPAGRYSALLTARNARRIVLKGQGETDEEPNQSLLKAKHRRRSNSAWYTTILFSLWIVALSGKAEDTFFKQCSMLLREEAEPFRALHDVYAFASNYFRTHRDWQEEIFHAGGEVNFDRSDDAEYWDIVVSDALKVTGVEQRARMELQVCRYSAGNPNVVAKLLLQPRRLWKEAANDMRKMGIFSTLIPSVEKREEVHRFVVVEMSLELGKDGAFSSRYSALRYDAKIVTGVSGEVPFRRREWSAWALCGFSHMFLPDGTLLKPLGRALRGDAMEWLPGNILDVDGARIWLEPFE